MKPPGYRLPSRVAFTAPQPAIVHHHPKPANYSPPAYRVRNFRPAIRRALNAHPGYRINPWMNRASFS